MFTNPNQTNPLKCKEISYNPVDIGCEDSNSGSSGTVDWDNITNKPACFPACLTPLEELFVPLTRTITINGETQSLSENRSWTLTTSEVTEGTRLYYTNARGIGSLLTDYVSGAGVISSADSILSAIQKLNGNISTIGTGYVPYTGATTNLNMGSFNVAANLFNSLKIGIGNSSSNVAIGNNAMFSNGSATSSVAIGNNSLLNMTGGLANTAIGENSLSNLTSANYNVGIGNASLGSLSTGVSNFAGGSYSGTTLTTGNYNTYVGYITGDGITTGSNNTIIGARIQSLSSSLSNNILIADGQGNIRFKDDNTNTILSRLAGTGTRMVTASTNGELSTTALPTGSQWITSGSNIYYTGGNVGIGTSTPGTSPNNTTLGFINGCIVQSRTIVPQLTLSANIDGDFYSATYKTTNPASQIILDGFGGTTAFRNAVSGTAGNPITWLDTMFIAASGNILIATTTDNGLDKLQVNGKSYLGGNITQNGSLSAWSGGVTVQQVAGSSSWSTFNSSNLSFLGNNWYFDGANKYYSNGYATRITQDNTNGYIALETAPTGVANASITFNQALRVNYDGSVLLNNVWRQLLSGSTLSYVLHESTTRNIDEIRGTGLASGYASMLLYAESAGVTVQAFGSTYATVGLNKANTVYSAYGVEHNMNVLTGTYNIYMGGTIANTIDSTGVLNTKNIYPRTDNTYYLGKNSASTPFAWKGVILKDTTNGNYYRIEVTAGVIVATAL